MFLLNDSTHDGDLLQRVNQFRRSRVQTQPLPSAQLGTVALLLLTRFTLLHSVVHCHNTVTQDRTQSTARSTDALTLLMSYYRLELAMMNSRQRRVYVPGDRRGPKEMLN